MDHGKEHEIRNCFTTSSLKVMLKQLNTCTGLHITRDFCHDDDNDVKRQLCFQSMHKQMSSCDYFILALMKQTH